MKPVKSLKAVGWLSGSGYQIHIHNTDHKSTQLRVADVEKPKKVVKPMVKKP